MASSIKQSTSLTNCQFLLFAGQRKSTANQQKLLYILGSKMAICVADEFDSYESTNRRTNRTTYESYG